MQPAAQPGSIHEIVSGRELVALLYRLARNRATGVIELARPTTRGRTLVLFRGQLVVSARDEGREVAEALRRFATEPKVRARFDGGAAACPPGHRRLPIDSWALAYLESSLSGSGANHIATELAGVRVSVREELAPDSAHLDETGQRLLAALRRPRRADELPAAARAPRFRTLAFLFALDRLGALERRGVGTLRAASAHAAASRALGIDTNADRAAVKRAYRRLARALHPDLRCEAPIEKRRALELKLAAVNRAYRVLLHG